MKETEATRPSAMASVCGIFCSACSFYIATHEDPARLDKLASSFGVSREAVRCDGCRGGHRIDYCANCHMFQCATERGYQFCAECPECPCAELETFMAERPHRADIRRDLVRIAEIGPEAWLVEATERHSCPDCGTLNSSYDLACRTCGRDPSSPFVQEHRALIITRLRQDGARRR